MHIPFFVYALLATVAAPSMVIAAELGERCQKKGDCTVLYSKCTPENGIKRCHCIPGHNKAGTNQCVSACGTNDPGCAQICLNPSFGTYICDCEPGYQLNADMLTCDDIDECTLNTDGCDQGCLNTPAGSYTCTCGNGYKLDTDSHTCNDIDECTLNTDGCDQGCLNTPAGSYTCTCGSGYLLDSDSHTCNDIDECTLNTDGCDQGCLNTPAGSYTCTCGNGYLLDGDSHTCNDIDECTLNTDGCDQGCLNTPAGSYTCTCGSGYLLDSDSHTCNDIDECTLNTDGCDQGCLNTPAGSYTCTCGNGYLLDGDSHTCNDIDECTLNTDGCDQGCLNTPAGSYTCTCGSGYLLDSDSHTCNDIDECTLNTDGCDQGCLNTPAGSYTCTCGNGYLLDGDSHTCNDIDECTLNTDGCDQGCLNTPAGSYTCTCGSGYLLDSDSHTCNDIDECTLNTDGCDQGCLNTPAGSYTCTCGNGYLLDGDSHTCNDIDECTLNTDGCDQGCLNTPAGSYTCTCGSGYLLDSDSHTCNEVSNPCFGIPCQHGCIVTSQGTPTCTCNPGYALAPDGVTCIGILECPACDSNEHCANSQCVCNPGYTRGGGGPCVSDTGCTYGSWGPYFRLAGAACISQRSRSSSDQVNCPDTTEITSCTDCVVSAWFGWVVFTTSPCVETNSRTIITQPLNGGNACPALSDTRLCDTGCTYGSWGPYIRLAGAACISQRSRSSSDPVNCPDTTEITSCTDCVVSAWFGWVVLTTSPCVETNSRTIITQPLNGGNACPALSDTRSCVGGAVDCVMSDWGDWTYVDSTICYWFRQRSIITPPANGGVECTPATETVTVACDGGAVDCVMSDWGDWTYVVDSTTCYWVRQRSITTSPANGGTECPLVTETVTVTCAGGAVDCVMSDWGDWTYIVDSTTCYWVRQRSITTPPANGGAECPPATETVTATCAGGAVDCVMSDWGDWTYVVDFTTCYWLRQRSITTPPANGGAECPPATETVTATCAGGAVDCVMSDWGDWTYVVDFTTCYWLRQRSITTPPANGGAECPPATETVTVTCAGGVVDCVMSDWGDWTYVDSTTCYWIRQRNIITPPANGGAACPPETETVAVTCGGVGVVNCVVSPWSNWIQVSTATPCYWYRVRSIITPPANGGTACPSLQETKGCDDGGVVACVVSEWSGWVLGTSLPCHWSRTRVIITPAANGGAVCSDLIDYKSCA